MSLGQFLQAVAPYPGKAILVLCHDDADSDALGSASVLASVLGGQAGVPQKLSEHARELQIKLGLQIQLAPDIESYELVIIVDTADSQQLPGCLPAEYLLVDHHANNSLLAGARAAVYEQTDSTCQLVWQICRALGKPLTANQALALGAGIMGDTRSLVSAANETIADLASILAAGGVSYRQLLDVFSVADKVSRQVRLEALFAAELHTIGEWLVASAELSKNYVYYLAMMLVELGADAALVGYQQGEDCFIRLAKNTGAPGPVDSLAVLAAAVAHYPRTNLWGNADYAGFNGRGQVQDISQALLAALAQAIGPADC